MTTLSTTYFNSSTSFPSPSPCDSLLVTSHPPDFLLADLEEEKESLEERKDALWQVPGPHQGKQSMCSRCPRAERWKTMALQSWEDQARYPFPRGNLSHHAPLTIFSLC